MLVPGILGFHGIFLLSLLGFCIVIRQKWKNAVARKAEITNLLAAAAEESLMAEIEAVNQYSCMPRVYQCAVCFSPTTTRCSRCKAVRYCSGKCQIIHWRQGHKDACHPLATAMPLIEGSSFFGIAASQKQFEDHRNDFEREDKTEVSFETASMISDDGSLKPCSDAEETHASFASSSNSSVDGFQSSKARNELLVDVSGDEVAELSTFEGPERPSVDVLACDLPEMRTTVRKIKQTIPPSPESTNSVIGVSGTSCTRRLEKLKLSHNDAEVNSRQILGGKMAVFDDVRAAKLVDKKPVGGDASSDFLVNDASKSRSSSSLSYSRSDLEMKGIEDDSHLSNSKFVKPLSSIASRAVSASAGRLSTSSKSLLPSKISDIPSLPQNACHGLKTSMQKVVQQFRASKPLKSHLLSSENEVVGKNNDKMIFPYDLFMKLYAYDEVELSPFGLTNCGNSCYANAVLQSLVFTRPLSSYLVQKLHSRACQRKAWCFICELECLILKAKEGNSPVSPIGILSKIQKIGSNLGHGREEDAHEFLRCAVDTMQSVCLKEVGTKGKLAEETTLVGLTFGGFLLSKIKCLKCLGKSERFERMMDLTVEIDGDIGTLEDALAQFTATEVLVGENKYYCNRCKSYEKAKKKLTVLEEPNILTIVLKRFQSGNFGKLNKSVRFPEVLNMAPYMSGTTDGSPIYNLYAVVVHLDVMSAAFSGHYVCYVKNSYGAWFRVDDSNVMPVELETVLLEEAYMLLYARHTPRPPALMRNKVVSHGAKSKRRSLEAVSSSLNPSNFPSVDSKEQRKPRLNSDQFFDGDEWRYRSIHRFPTVDSSSESSSILSWSDASSCSTASTKDSSTSEDLSDFIFGDTGPNWYSRYGIPSDSVASSSHQNFDTDSEVENNASQHRWREGSRRDGNPAILCTHSYKHYSNLSHQFVNSSNRGIDSERVILANPYEVRLRRASGNISTQTFY